jgi:flagellar motor switch protein FliN
LDPSLLKAFGEAAAPGLSGALAGLLGREVKVGYSRAFASTGGDLSSQWGRASYLLTSLKGSGGLQGSSFLLAGEKDASVMADLLIGQDGSSAPEKMTELHLSAFGEVVHQAVDVLLQEVRVRAGSKALWEMGETLSVEPGQVGDKLGRSVSLEAVVFEFSVPDAVSGELLVCFPEPTALKLVSGAEKPAEDAPAGNVQTGVSSINTQTGAGGAVVQPFENELSGSARPTGGNIGLLLDVPLRLTVELGRTTKLVKEILALAPGSVVELDKLAGEAVDILVNEKLIAKGEVVVIDENFGVRITEIINPEERLTAVQS